MVWVQYLLKKTFKNGYSLIITQLTIETLEPGVKYVQS